MRFVSCLLFAAVAVSVTSPIVRADEPRFRPIFDGKTLNGWRGDENFWRVENGALVGESTPDNPCKKNTFLVWDQGEVDDFELKLKFRISGSPQANSGIQFRGIQREDGHVIGYQADIDKAGRWVGALYDEATGRGVLAKRGQSTLINEQGERETEEFLAADELFSFVKQDDWNEYRITARGADMTLEINGHRMSQVTDHQAAHQDLIGLLALQLHAGPPMKIEFKEIELKRFPLTNGRKKIVFVAGTPSHGYFSHEHNAGCLLLAGKLNQAAKEHGLPVTCTVYTNGWPKDPTAMDNVDCVVSYCDGGARHYLNDRLDDFDHLAMEHGVGLVCIHYAVETLKGKEGDHFLKWIGGYFEPHWSVNPHWTARFDKLPDHPITRGVQPFEINDEWYYHMRFQPDMQGVTPILTDLPPRETLNRKDGPHSGNPYVREAVLQRKEPQHVAWAYERPGGKGRGFGFTGGHFHKNWQHDEFRKIVLNAIVWTAGLEVPDNGVPSKTPTKEELEANQDYPKPGSQQKKKKRARQKQKVTQPAAANNGEKPIYSSPVITAQTPGHAVNIDVDITGAKKLFLVATDGKNGYSCDWCDWAEPRLLTNRDDPSPQPLTELKWKTATADWGQVRKGKNAGGGPLRIHGKPVKYGIGTHANSIIEFALPANHRFTRFQARAGLDNGGTDQNGGTSVQFHVFTQTPSRKFLANVTGSSSNIITASHEAADAIDQLHVHEGLAVTLFASEPMMTNPSSIDIDHLGRVWVCEGINYRAFRNKDVIGDRQEGDRILILEDTNRDARADKATVFYQGHDVDAAHGILVLPTPTGRGLRVLISALDKIFFLIDEDGDLKADRKEPLFTGIKGAQHDHGIHACHFGPDGKLYFNFGNNGGEIHDKNGQLIIDKAGNEVRAHRQPYQEGMVFRCNLDGSEFETLGWNFRNNWEVCVDSFGTMWQSDNDDDGNRGVRINYVLEYGNYGYKDEFTGAGWRSPRTGWEEEIPLRHWHLNDPGVVPNLLQTGAGAPTGICFYEGNLLPKTFQGAILHTDAGTNVCRAYVPKPKGAGYTARIVPILDGSVNKWFRPSDVCIAPDGSILVADWYDAGVGGHRMVDPNHGRLFRVAPQGESSRSYKTPAIDVSTVEGAVTALQSPNMATRYLGWTALKAMGEQAVPALEKLFQSENPVYRARALWLLGHLDLPTAQTLDYINRALNDSDDRLAVTAIRLGRQLIQKIPLSEYRGRVHIEHLTIPMARELLIALREIKTDKKPSVWAGLASYYDGQDRWYLETLGIAAEGDWDACLSAWIKSVDSLQSKAARDIIWRSRAAQTPELLQQLILDKNTPTAELPRYFRAMDFQKSASKPRVLETLAFSSDAIQGLDDKRVAFIRAEALNRLNGFDIDAKPAYRDALLSVLDDNRGTAQYVRLVDRFQVQERYPDLLAIAQQQPQSQLAVEAIGILLAKQQHDLLAQSLRSQDRPTVEKTLTALQTAGNGRATKLLLDLLKEETRPVWVRRAAIKALGASLPGAKALLKLAQGKEYSDALKDTLAATLNTAQWRVIREPAVKLFPPPPGKNQQPLPPIPDLATRKGDAKHGGVLFHTTATCATCHQVGMLGKEVGPNLSEIGSKLSKAAMWEAILYPSAAISHNYENWLIVDEEGNQYAGLLVSETPEAVQIKDNKGIVRTIPASSIEIKKKQETSLMPADLQKNLTVEELVDIVEYMTTLKKK